MVVWRVTGYTLFLESLLEFVSLQDDATVFSYLLSLWGAILFINIYITIYTRQPGRKV